jgi:hypothetical protein
MEAASTSETSVNLSQTTRRYNPEDSHLQPLNISNVLMVMGKINFHKNFFEKHIGNIGWDPINISTVKGHNSRSLHVYYGRLV